MNYHLRKLERLEIFQNHPPVPNILWASGLIFGLLVRVAAFSHSNTLEIDESALLINILQRDWNQLWTPLDYNQHAPIGYLLCLKLATKLGGESYFTLRICNLLIGFITILLFALYSRKWFLLPIAALATWILALSPEPIFYSVVAKQYAFDLGFSSILLVICIPHFQHNVNTFKFPFELAVLGSILVWMSHPIIFVLIGYLAATTLQAFWRKTGGLRWSVVLTAVWFGSFILSYIVMLSHSTRDHFLKEFWHSYFAPFPPSSLADLKWYLDRFFDLFFNSPFFFTVSGAVMVLFVCLGISRLWHLNKPLLIFLVSPILCALLASMFKLYPFYGRFLLFSVPLLLVLFSYGLEIMFRLPRYGVTCVNLVAVLLLIFPMLSGGKILMYGLLESYPKNELIASLETYVGINDAVFANNGIIHRIRIYYYLNNDIPRMRLMRLFSDMDELRSVAPRSGRENWLLLENRMENYSEEISEIRKSLRLEEVAKFNGKRPIGLYRILPNE
jgi:hypothetical protein